MNSPASFKSMILAGTLKRADAMKARYRDIRVRPDFNLRDRDAVYEAAVEELTDYIMSGGQLPALEVAPLPDGSGVELIDGHRRHDGYGRAIARGFPIEWVVQKLREWSPRLRCVVARALERDDAARREYLFAPSKRSACYSRSGWGASWQDAMNAWIRSQDPDITETDLVTSHPLYFALQDVRPMAITAKLNQRAQDAYDFAAHTNPATTHKNYDRRRVKRASATE